MRSKPFGRCSAAVECVGLTGASLSIVCSSLRIRCLRLRSIAAGIVDIVADCCGCFGCCCCCSTVDSSCIVVVVGRVYLLLCLNLTFFTLLGSLWFFSFSYSITLRLATFLFNPFFIVRCFFIFYFIPISFKFLFFERTFCIFGNNIFIFIDFISTIYFWIKF